MKPGAVQHNPEAVVRVVVPFGHTQPQWILPFGGEITEAVRIVVPESALTDR